MFIKSFLLICKPTLTLKNFISLHLSYNKKKMSTLENVIDGLNDVKHRIKVVSQKQKECYGEPRLVAVSKTKPIEHIIGIYENGQRHFGENYVQELISKSTDVEILNKCPDIKWHFIGHIQKNKVPKLLMVPGLHVIETIDSEKLASAVNDGWKKLNKESKLKIMVQVNTSNEKEKFGTTTDSVVDLYKFIIEKCDYLELIGLMTIGQYGYDCSQGPNPDFLTLIDCKRNVCDKLQLNPSKMELSMGMSDDFEHAIELGSTNVRVGSSIFGFRPRKEKQ
ncbi:pyridoxal phosphate homeostasis protein isoform X1 [Melanaphis sacchari]|uniref:pyridoxal phosphate homeostasis protein isoform X1 n=2 Tax=Melanaphis sacchari TaxID=742174 RepID=UPI000DC1369B|nr:pyridoxal phosphate homeostasis protein isoform X1 [Melanaphis sacchari]XP_025208993.1 pyridoxal phosphate homeostasis protein isoform X1 [Melanaphis sacchari]